MLQHLREMTADNDGFTLIFFGTRMGSELRELTHTLTGTQSWGSRWT
ncbi:hypothetical protein ABFP30_001392 [Enterobacter bugandensis]|jgi:hypothetical protein